MLEGLRFVTCVTFSAAYPLVNIQKTMGNHHFWWVNKLFLWPFSIAMLNYQEGSYYSWISFFLGSHIAFQCFVPFSLLEGPFRFTVFRAHFWQKQWSFDRITYPINIPFILISDSHPTNYYPISTPVSPEYPTNIPLFSYQYRRLTWTSAMAAMAELVSVAVRNLQK